MGSKINDKLKGGKTPLLEEFRELEKNRAFDKILHKFHSIQEQLKDITDRQSAEILYIVAKAFFVNGNLDQVQTLANRIITWCDKEGIADLSLRVKSLEGVCFTAMGEYSKAEQIYTLLLKEKEALKDDYYKILMNFATVAYFQGKLNKAKELYEEAYKFALQKHLPTDQILNNLSAVLLDMGYYYRALELSNKVKEIKIKNNDWHGLVISLDHLTLIYSNLGENNKAWESVLTALQIAEEKKFLRELAGIYSVKGLLEIRDFKFQEAVESLEKARVILSKIKVFDILPAVVFRLTFALQQLNKYEEAEIIIKEMEELSAKIQSYFLVTYTSIARGMNYYYLKKYLKAKRIFKRVIKTTKTFQQYRLFSETLLLVAFLLLLNDKVRLLKRVLKFGFKNTLELKLNHYFILFATSLMLFYLINDKVSLAEKIFKTLIVEQKESVLPDYSKEAIELYASYKKYANKFGKKEVQFKAYTLLFRILQDSTGVL